MAEVKTTIHRAASSAEERALLRHVTADLSDHARQYVYADWLEEQNDERGPFLRVYLQAFERRLDGLGDHKGPVPVDQREDFQRSQTLPQIPTAFPEVWSDLLALPERQRLLREHPYLKPWYGVLLAGATPAIRAEASPAVAANSVALGTSRFNGLPDLPIGTGWPCAKSGATMRFLAQFDLADFQGMLAGNLILNTGLLSLFLDPDDSPSFHVRLMYTPAETTLARVNAPDAYSPSYWYVEKTEAISKTNPLSLSDYLHFSPVTKGEVYEQFLAQPGIVHPETYFDGAEWTHLLLSTCRNVVEGWDEDVFDTYIQLLESLENDAIFWSFGDGGRLHVLVDKQGLLDSTFQPMISTEV